LAALNGWAVSRAARLAFRWTKLRGFRTARGVVGGHFGRMVRGPAKTDRKIAGPALQSLLAGPFFGKKDQKKPFQASVYGVGKGLSLRRPHRPSWR